jgi:hypothetical protein
MLKIVPSEDPPRHDRAHHILSSGPRVRGLPRGALDGEQTPQAPPQSHNRIKAKVTIMQEIITDLLNSKYCPRCATVHPFGSFAVNRSRKDGHSGYCKACMSVVNYRRYREQSDVRIRMKHNTKKWRDENRERFNKNAARYMKTHAVKEKNKARLQAWQSIETPNQCSSCGSTGTLERHHPDYAKPLDVIFLCRECHLRTHGKEPVS